MTFESEQDQEFYTLAPIPGLCRLDDAIINLAQVSLIRKLDGKTLIYCTDMAAPAIFPVKTFEQIKEIVFSVEDDDDDEDYEDDGDAR